MKTYTITFVDNVYQLWCDDALINESKSPLILANYAFGMGAREVKHNYDLKKAQR